MKRKFKRLLTEKCKDMGLTDKAIESLTELGIGGLKEEASDEEIETAVDSLVPYAKAMQAEITRKTRREKQPSEKPSEGEGEEGEAREAEKVPEWAKGIQEQLASLKAENDALKAAKAKADRAAAVAEKGKALGIPEALLKRVSFADDADLDKELGALKQDLVTMNLMPKGATHEVGTTEQALSAAAEAWAKTLPDA